jgi:suppressor of fused-like protein
MGVDRCMTENEGRAAIDAALRALYPQEPVTFGAGVGTLAEVRAYFHPATTADLQHWHYVTLGLSELETKTSTDPKRSGWGFELTMRVEAPAGESELPDWPVLELAKLAAYVYDTATILDDGHHVTLEGSIHKDAPLIRGLAFRRDPELGSIDTPNGALTFVQAVGVTGDEADLLARWSVKSFLDVLAKRTPLLVTRPERLSLLADPAIGPMIEQRAVAEGSAESAILADTLTWDVSRWPRKGIHLFLGPADMVRRSLRTLLAGRTSRGKEFRIMSGGRILHLHLGDRDEWEASDSTVDLNLSPVMLAELDAFLGAGEPSLKSKTLPGFVLTLVA